MSSSIVRSCSHPSWPLMRGAWQPRSIIGLIWPVVLFAQHAASRGTNPPRGTFGWGTGTGTSLGERGDDFEHFFLAYERTISGFLWRMTGDEQVAGDLSQETFLRAWQRFDRIRAYERPDAWLFRVATNLALHHLRHIRHVRRRDARSDDIPHVADEDGPSESDPSRRLVERDLVRETLLELTPKARALLILREAHGLSAEEAGGVLGMSGGAVKVGLWRARQQFRDIYMRKGGLS
jgi:RNA polymerase sigma-70 factor, ECF subfamily